MAAIIVATDGSPPADRAVRWAADEAVLRGLPLQIVHVIDEAPYDVLGSPDARITDRATATAEALLAEAHKLALDRHPGLAATTEIARGSVPVALRERAATAAALVLGHRGRGGFASLLLGSIGLRVAGHARGPVIVVRGEPGPVRGEVVLGIDPDTADDAALAYAFEAAALRDARLRVLHAFQLSEGPVTPAGYYEDMAQIEEARRHQIDDLLTPYRERHGDVAVVTDMVRDHPVQALTTASRQADLLVVNARGRSLLRDMLLGSVSHGVLHHAHCPVAVLGRYA
ncbi:universal stress protein [Thermomonospora catenispora]|uniref:universal stress protein n=1 Tax=Thermomonospora catenispora TaxID=2493090 RepID=UPI0011200DF9|nr:universal stress protein [Thermomonospora catenispora]TNY36594.1 universal stress protein [Thermomonospora catenispora]